MEDLSKDTEIQKALEQFEAKNAEQVASLPPASEKAESSKMVGWLMKHSGGLIKEERQAEYVLLVFVVVIIFISIFLFFKSRPDTSLPQNYSIEPEESMNGLLP